MNAIINRAKAKTKAKTEMPSVDELYGTDTVSYTEEVTEYVCDTGKSISRVRIHRPVLNISEKEWKRAIREATRTRVFNG